MADINVMTFTGRLTSDATYKVTTTGKCLLTMNVAVNTGFGQYSKTVFLKVQQWGERGAKVCPFCKKGQLIGGSGELSTNSWTTSNGNARTDLVVDVLSFQLLGSKKENEQTPQKAVPKAAEEGYEENYTDEDGEEIPF